MMTESCQAINRTKKQHKKLVHYIQSLFYYYYCLCYSLKILFESRGCHSLSLYGKEQLGHSAINNYFCVPQKKKSYRFQDMRVGN